MQEVEIRTGVWYHDRPVKLTFPNSWDIAAYWPDTPPPLTDDEIRGRLASPVNQPPLRALAQGKERPVIVVDDLSRPTPVFRIMPYLLEEFHAAGVSSSDIRILVATGTHAAQDDKALVNKIGREAYDACHVIVHNDKKKVKYVGETSFKTPVYVDPEIIDSDLIVGVGGIYPQHSTGFGGGGKLALGVLGRRSIKHLHFGHRIVGGNYNIENDFRRDVTEIARMIGLNTIVTLHTNAHLEIVNLTAGDYTAYYTEAARFSREKYDAPAPDDADVVIANAYPSDVSYTFMRKANKPVLHAPEGATTIMVASNHGGLGHHGLYPQGKSPRYIEFKELWDRVSIMKPGVIAKKIVKNIFKRRVPKQPQQHSAPSPGPKTARLWIYTPPGGCTSFGDIEGVGVLENWESVLRLIRAEHEGKERIKVRIYPCASLQCIADKKEVKKQTLEVI